MNLKKQISSTFSSMMKKPIEGKVLQYWERAVQNEAATFESFVASLVASEEYKHSALAQFVETLHDTVRSDKAVADPEALFDSFWTFRPNPSVPVTECDMVRFVTRQPFFDDHFYQIVHEVFTFEMNRQPTDDEVKRLSNKAKASETRYTLTQLMKDVVAAPPPKASSSSPDAISASTTLTALAEPPEDYPIRSSSSSVAPGVDQENLDGFEDVFSRPMFVQEYFKYIVQRDTHDMTWSDLHAHHTNNYQRLRTMFQNYTGKVISEYYFVKKYLYAVDNESFFDSIVDSIVTSNEYRIGMQKVVCERYQSMFDQALEASDVEYIFKIIKDKKLDIVSDELSDLLSQLKDETDGIVTNIFKVYMEALKRAPDMGEVEQFVPFFRERNDTMTDAHACAELERILVNMLEFHEILKQRMRELYAVQHGKDMTQSRLYTCLNDALSHVSTLTMKTLDDVLTSVINQ